MEFNEKVAIITGGAGGIGAETARILLQQGAKVTLVDLNMTPLEDTAASINANDKNTLLVTADVSSEEKVQNYVQKTINTFGKVDIFVNNAGTEGKFGLIKDTEASNLDTVLNVNLKGVFYGIKHVVPEMIKHNKGSIINTASVAGLIGSPGMGPYVASKHAVLGITKTAALEYAPFGIRVNAVCPGPIDNRMMRSIEKGASPENPNTVYESFKEMIPFKRYGASDEIAELIVFLASDKSSYITGSYYTIDGGLTAD